MLAQRLTCYHYYYRTTLQIASYKPDNYLTTYIEYNTTENGLVIELLYRKKGSTKWKKAFNSAGKAAVLLDIKRNSVVSVCYS